MHAIRGLASRMLIDVHLTVLGYPECLVQFGSASLAWILEFIACMMHLSLR